MLLLGDCRDGQVVEDLFGSVSEFARQVEENGNEFAFGDIVVKYDERTDTHTFWDRERREKRASGTFWDEIRQRKEHARAKNNADGWHVPHEENLGPDPKVLLQLGIETHKPQRDRTVQERLLAVVLAISALVLGIYLFRR